MDRADATSSHKSSNRNLPRHRRYAKPTTIPHHANANHRRDVDPADTAVDALQLDPLLTPTELQIDLAASHPKAAALLRPKIVGLLNMAEFTHNVRCAVPIDEPIFQPSPAEIVFDSFEPLADYSATLRMRNNDAVARRIKLLQPDSSAFAIEVPAQLRAAGGKVAPGMEVTFRVRFAPRAAQDYECDLMCVTEREKFVVPLRARGLRACFDLPDVVDFGLQPVRREAVEPFQLRNTGGAAGRFSLATEPPFAVTPSEGYLGPNEAVQLSFRFTPSHAGHASRDLLIAYDTGERCVALLTGAAADMDVALERTLLTLPPCYISCVVRRTVRLHNRSNIKVSFEWMQFADDAAEAAESTFGFGGGVSFGSLSATAPVGAAASLARSRRSVASELPSRPFEHANVRIEPARGEIYAGGLCEMTIEYHPDSCGSLAATAYCEVTGRTSRLPLTIRGEALGPKATWLYDSLDIGDIYVLSRHRYEVVLENHGEVDADYRMLHVSPEVAKRFTFSPVEGHIASGEQLTVEVELLHDKLGPFSEVFEWVLEGQPAPLPLTIKGRIIGPSFHFSVGAVEFGAVALGSAIEQELELHNTSDIPMRYTLRSSHAAKLTELAATPASGTLLPHRMTRLAVSFCSRTPQHFEGSVVVDVEGIGDGLLALPVTATNVLPALVAVEPELAYGDVFRHNPTERTLVVRNDSPLPAEFEVLEQRDADQRSVALLEATPRRAVIRPHGTASVAVTVTAARLGPLSLPLYVGVVGAAVPSFTIDVSATAVGPTVVIESGPILDFGKTTLLKEVAMCAVMVNSSPIVAEYRALLKRHASPFVVAEPRGLLKPGERRELAVSICLEEVGTVHDELQIEVRDVPDMTVRLSASGAGTTVEADRPLEAFNFGHQFSHRLCQDEFTLYNKGRKSVTVLWSNTADEADAKTKKAAAKKGAGSSDAASPPPAAVFHVTPAKVLMEANSEFTFSVKGFAHAAADVKETLKCHANDGRAKPILIYEAVASASFIAPIVQPSSAALSYEHVWSADAPQTEQWQLLELHNVSALLVHVLPRVPPPFSVDVPELTLEPDGRSTLTVAFDPAHGGAQLCKTFESVLTLQYREHPQRDRVSLVGRTVFPNLDLSLERADFGAVLNGSSKVVPLVLTNTTSIDAEYCWYFAESSDPSAASDLKFDVLPIHGRLAPGESERAELHFNGAVNSKTRALALCRVVGGPQYELPMHAESSPIGYKLDHTVIEYGVLPFERVEQREVLLTNTGRVTFDFAVNVPPARSELARLEVLPSSGTLPAGGSVKMNVWLRPGSPGFVREHFYVTVANFDPEEVVLLAEAVYPRVAASLQREETPQFTKLLSEASNIVAAQRAERGIGLADAKGMLAATFQSAAFLSFATSAGASTKAPSESGRRSDVSGRPQSAAALSDAGGRPSSVASTRSKRATSAGHPRGVSKRNADKHARSLAALEVESEAERLHVASMAAQLAQQEARDSEAAAVSAAATAAAAASAPATRSKPARTARASTSRALLLKTSLAALPSLPPAFVAARYVLDFGHVNYGNSRRRSFRLRNLGYQPLSFQLDKSALRAMGLTVDPDKVVKLPGMPEPEVIDLNFTYSSAHLSEDQMGPYTHEVRLPLKPGPPIVVVARVNVTKPEVVLSTESLDYGQVRAGQLKAMYIEMRNVKSVLAEWEVKRPIEGARDWDYFRCTPSSGSLPPGGHCKVEISFAPATQRSHHLKLNFKTSNNPRPTVLALRGTCTETRFELEPSVLTMPPVMPCSEPACVAFRLANPSAFPIEVFATEFDEEYRREEEALRDFDGFGEDDVARLPPREPGEPLWPVVVQAHESQQELRALAAAAKASQLAVIAAAADEAAEEVAQNPLAVDGSPGSPTADETAAEAAAHETTDPVSTRRNVVLLLGPPLSRAAEQAELVAGALNLPVVSLDRVLLEAEEAAREMAREAAPMNDSDTAPAGEVDTEAAAVAAGAGEDGAFEPLISASLPAELLAKHIASAVSADEHPRGLVVVFPERPSPAAGPLVLAEAVDAAIPRPRWTVLLEVSDEVLEARARHEHVAALGALPQPPPPPDMDEDAYDMLDEGARVEFERQRVEARRAMTSWEARRTELEDGRRARFESLRAELASHRELLPELSRIFGLEPSPPPAPPQAEPGDSEMAEAGGDEAAAADAPADESNEAPESEGAVSISRAPRLRILNADAEDPQALASTILEGLPEQVDLFGSTRQVAELPPPQTFQLMRRPRERDSRPPPSGFEILTLGPPVSTKAGAWPPTPAMSGAEWAASSEGEQPESPVAEDSEAPATDEGAAEPSRASRWILPPHSSIPLELRYTAASIGSTSARLRFEMRDAPLGSRPLALSVTASASYPTISRDYRSVFHRKAKNKNQLETHKSYVVSRSAFEFGPLLVGRAHPGEEEQPHARHAEQLHISNTGNFPLTVHFSFLNGGAGIHTPLALTAHAPPASGGEGAGRPIFALGPLSLQLAPDETSDVIVSAFPDRDGLFEEQLVCTIRDNPQPVVFPLSAIGSTPASSIDVTEISFERLLLRRTDSRTVTITSLCALPMRWAVTEASLRDLVGERSAAADIAELDTAAAPGGADDDADFTLSASEGVLAPGSEASIVITFHAREPKEASGTLVIELRDTTIDADAEPAQTLSVALTAEAYSIDVDVTWPDPEEDGINLGAFKVVDPQATHLELHNKGKYDVAFEFETRKAELRDVMKLEPIKGTLAPGGTTQRIEVALSAREELTIAKETIARVKFTELLTGEVLSSLAVPLKLTARARWSSYAIIPRGLNFGALPYRSERERTIEIANTGEFPFRYRLRSCAEPATDFAADAGDGAGSLTLGRFVVSPTGGVIEAGGAATLTVTYAAGAQAEANSATFRVDVADRSATNDPEGFLYELFAESCIPGIDTAVADIFEEQAVVSHGAFGTTNLLANVFGEEERVFCFGSHMVGKEVSERFKITNPFKVTCTVNLRTARKQVAGVDKGKGAASAGAAEPCFDVEPKKVVLPPHEHRYVRAFFTPREIGTHCATFEAEVEAGADPKTRRLDFSLLGEGTLPTVLVVGGSKDGLASLAFPRLRTGQAEHMQLDLLNSGVLPASFTLRMKPGVFTCGAAGERLQLAPKEKAAIEIGFSPTTAGGFESSMLLTVDDNPYDQTTIKLTGEGFVQDVAFELLPARVSSSSTAAAGAAAAEVLDFGDVEVGSTETLTFTLRNHSSHHRRFVWTEVEGLRFEPRVGHLHAHSSKQITAIFLSAVPLALDEVEARLDMQQIRYEVSRTPADWDDSMKSVRFLSDEEWRERKAREEAEAAAAEAADLAAKEAAEAAAAAKDKKGGKNESASKESAPKESAPKESAAHPSEAEQAKAEEPNAGEDAEPVASSGATHKVVDVGPEPKFEVLADDVADDTATRSLSLRFSARCERARFECSTDSLLFRPTMMFQTRTQIVELRNVGEVVLHYHWKLDDAGAPFSVSPSKGEVAAGATLEVTVSFSPLEVDDYGCTLSCEVANVGSDTPPLRIPLSGKSSRPYCHFEITESDYVRAGRRPSELPNADGIIAPLDPSTRVIEVASLGTRVRNTRRFYLLNPTSVSYEFSWTEMSAPASAAEALGAQPFRCATRRGLVLPGRKFDMVFEFTPEEARLYESFWLFSVPSLGLTLPFLFVGNVAEPSVSLDRVRHHFGPVLVGQRVRETVLIRNSEHLPFPFSFDPASYAAAGDSGLVGLGSPLVITPASGVVGPQSEAEVEIAFSPTLPREFNYNVELRIKNASRPRILNVKCDGFVIAETVAVVDSHGTRELSSHAASRIDLGSVHVNDRATRTLVVSNGGSFSFDVSLSLKWPASAAGDATKTLPVSISPARATVRKNERIEFELAFTPRSGAALPAGLAVVVAITNGRTYTVQLGGRGHRPKLTLSTREYSFGPCFVVDRGAPQVVNDSGAGPQRGAVLVRNDDDSEVYFDLKFEDTPALSVSVDRTVLAPGESTELGLVFAPPEVGAYEAMVPLLVNGLWPTAVAVRGEGCEMRLELKDPKTDQRVDFGAIAPGRVATRSVALVNRSRRAVQLSTAEAAAALAPLELRVALAGSGDEISLRPRESTQLSFQYAPIARRLPFSEPFVLRVCEVPQPLLLVGGSCAAIDVALETEQLAFGPVVLGSRISRRLILHNRGELPSAFSFPPGSFAPHFSVSPLKGLLQPHEEISLEVTFHPTVRDRDIRCERVPLTVAGMAPLKLSVTGQCVVATPEVPPLALNARARETTGGKLSVKNATQLRWTIHPAVSGEYLSGPEIFEVPPGGSADYPVTFMPLTMTTDEGGPHRGSVFFPLPDGSGILHEVEGTARAPACVSTVSRKFACKHPLSLSLEVHNWLKVPQRFRVDVQRGQDLDAATTLDGHRYIDVPASATREYTLVVHAHREGSVEAEVHFVNEKTGEYLHHVLKMKAEPAEVLQTIEMRAPVRQLATHEISLSNPLSEPADFKLACDNPEVAFPAELTVAPSATATARIEWRPLQPKDSSSRLTVTSPTLGLAPYALKLVVQPLRTPPVLHFSTPLGDSQTIRYRICSYLRKPCTYTVALAADDFQADGATVAAPAAEDSSGVEVAVDVTFEPTKLGASSAQLKVSNAEAGEYLCDLRGEGLPPKPQGPIAIKAGATAIIPFRNVFPTSLDFTMRCEPASIFSVAKEKETINNKKGTQITVSYKPLADTDPTDMGKLTVGSSMASWTYYLQGEPTS